jgi:DNA polymerase I-like protein with 3'-5' exonuclease and polymerase domains
MSTVAFDTETRGLDWWLPEQHAFLVTWATADGEWWAELDDPESPQLRQFIDAVHAADTIVGHNLPFDLHHIREAIGFDIAALGKELHDTDLMSRVLAPEGQNKGVRGAHALKNLAEIWLRVDAKDPEEHIIAMAKELELIGKTASTMRTAPIGSYFWIYKRAPEVMREYALADARYTYDLFGKFIIKAEQEPTSERIYQMERVVMPILLEAARVGMRTDQTAVRQFRREFTDARDELYERLTTELGDRALNAKKDWDDEWEEGPESLAEALQKIGVPLHARTDGGKYSTAKYALQEFEHDFPVIADLFEFRRLNRFLNTYIDPMVGVDVIHPSFSQLGAWTGRMSCRRPNMQNWPKRAGKHVRSVLIPREGYCFVVADYEGIEARLLAYYLGDPWYRELVAERDPHAWMCTQIWGGEIEQYMKGSNKEITHRQPAKNITFAITYGAGGPKVARMLRDAGLPSTIEDGRRFARKIKSSLPNYFYLTKDRIEPKVRQDGYVSTIMGRRNPVKGCGDCASYSRRCAVHPEQDGDKAYVGLNALIQGSAADIFKQGLINTNAAVTPLGAKPVLFVHDEIVVECPLGREQECLQRMDTAMCGAWDLNPPLAAEGSIAYNNYAEA